MLVVRSTSSPRSFNPLLAVAKRTRTRNRTGQTDRNDRELRIIGGKFRRSILKYAPEQTRPMKHRTREALFSLLGDAVKDRWVIDLFAGAGALALESLSRGAKRATLIERFVPARKIITENIELLNLHTQTEVLLGDAFRWARDFEPGDPPEPQLVFYSPPYRFYDERTGDMQQLIAAMIQKDRGDGVHVVEASPDFDFAALPWGDLWDVRSFPPARLGFLFLDRVESPSA